MTDTRDILGDDEVFASIVDGSISEITDSIVSRIEQFAFANCENLARAEFPNVSLIQTAAFMDCVNLTTASFASASAINENAFRRCGNLSVVNAPMTSSIGRFAFMECGALVEVSFPNAQRIDMQAFQSCASLSTVSFGPSVSYLGAQVFSECRQLTEVHLEHVSSVPIVGSDTFYYTPITTSISSVGRYGSVFVPASLHQSFLSAENWSNIASRIVSV